MLEDCGLRVPGTIRKARHRTGHEPIRGTCLRETRSFRKADPRPGTSEPPEPGGTGGVPGAWTEVRVPSPTRRNSLAAFQTSYAAEPLRGVITQGNEPIPVWPYPPGNERGIAFEPLYKTAPGVAMRDPAFYEYLALADALRDGRARERKYAEQELHRRFQKANARSES